MLDFRAHESEIGSHAIFTAGRVRGYLANLGKPQTVAALDLTPDGMETLAWKQQPAQAVSSGQVTATLSDMASEAQAGELPDATLPGVCARMTDPAWFRRRVRKVLRRENEVQEHARGEIYKAAQCYVSDFALQSIQQRNKANAATLENLEVVNEDGAVFNLAEVVKGSTSNPAVRRAELMVRCKGFDQVAGQYGLKGYLLTLTAPSRFHRMNVDGTPNTKWEGATPKDAQAYLSLTWAKIRAAWGRKGYMPFGFRVAEPHHDGCPHWHILLFMSSRDAGWFSPLAYVRGDDKYGAGALGIMGKHAHKDNPQEIGFTNKNARFDIKRLDQRGAVGYISKYISKNIDGVTEGGDSIGQDKEAAAPAETSAKRVRAWASTWGIRQFQQIGGPSVTVWRELRRLGEVPEQVGQRDLFASLQDTADMSDWGMFYHLQGGPKVARKDLPIKPFYKADSLGKYGDEVSRVYGLEWNSVQAGGWLLTQTREHTWTVQREGTEACNTMDAEVKDFMNVEKAVARFLSEAGKSGFDGANAVCTPRTRVNNCTGSDATPNGFDFSGFDSDETEIPNEPKFVPTNQVIQALKEARHLDAWHSQEAALWKSARNHENNHLEFEKWT
jgi:hypothetical protein